ncbi:MAG: TIGR03936 family radical SAM-associated protein [Thermoguttaceae bacterium]
MRIRFAKRGALRLIGHRDLMRCLERLFRRASLALAMSRGFHPKPQMTFPLALAVGIEGYDEVMEVALTESPPADALLARLRPHAPPGLELLSAEVLPPEGRKAHVRSAAYQIAVGPSRRREVEESVGRLLAADSCPVRRARRDATIDLRASLVELGLHGDVLQMRLRTAEDGSAGPRDVLAALGLEDLEHQGAHLARTAVEIDA